MDKNPHVLVVDDEEHVRNACQKILSLHDFKVSQATSGRQALDFLEKSEPDVVLLDVVLPDCSGLDLLSQIKSRHADVEVIVMTAFGSIDMAIKAIKSGAYDFLTKPFPDLEELPHAVNKAFEKKALILKNKRLESELFNRYSFSNIVGSGRGMKKVFTAIQDVAYSSSTVLIQGESGTGKELVAKAIHYNSPRKGKELVAFNCSALTETLIDSELFGHVKGAFTNAFSDKTGLFESADGSTIFLDEIGDMPTESQVRLLRVLQEGEIKPVGSNLSRKVDVRVMAASNKDLKELVAQKRFREDLFYRLSVIVINIPPLRDRREDIPVLAYYFLKKYNEKNGKEVKEIIPEVMSILESFEWNGNVRELENVIERGVVVAKGEALTMRDIPTSMIPKFSLSGGLKGECEPDLPFMPFKEAKEKMVDSFTRSYFSKVLSEEGGNISKVAQRVQIERSNLKKLLKKHGVNTESWKA